uniref:Uncharacterized protein n=1 Tax=Cannabis sativa TaxID=3483 RepID=A0A803NPE8_CANSA
MSTDVASYHGGDGDGDDLLDPNSIHASCKTSGESRKGRGRNVLANLEDRRRKAGMSLPLEFHNVSNRIVGLEKTTPNELNEEQWRLKFFTSEELMARSKKNALNRQKMIFPSTQGSVTMAETLHENQNMSRIENWKVCHTKKGTDEFVNEHAKEKYVRMKTIYDSQSSPSKRGQDVEIEILHETLGERRGNERGVGRKSKGQSGRRRSQPAVATEQPNLSQTIFHLQRHL